MKSNLLIRHGRRIYIRIDRQPHDKILPAAQKDIEKKCLYSLVVVENLWDKSPHINIFSFSESVGLHPLVPHKKVSMNCSWAKVFRAL